MPNTAEPPAAAPGQRRQARIAAVSGFFGTTLEYYDFLIYGTAAALYFGPVFFPNNSYDTMLALGSIGVAYVARPFGAAVWGHLGDRIGRKQVLLAILLTMGVATFLVGCIPSADMIGPAAPVILIAVRLVQGISAGGEQAGSALLALEHAPDDRRGFYTSWTQAGSQLGNFLAFVVFVPLEAVLSEGAMAGWGWRIPFWASAFVVLLTYVLRRRLSEPEVRQRLEREGLAHKAPLAAVLRHHGAAVVRIALASLCIAPAGLVYIFGLAYGTEEIGLSKSGLLNLVALASLIMIASQPLFGLLSDRIGRKPVFVTGAAGSAVMVPLWLNALNDGSWPQIYLFGLALMGVFVSMTSGVLLAAFLEMFPVDIRFSGMAVSFTTGIVITGFIPAIAQSMVEGNPDDWPSVAWLFVGLMAISGMAIASAPETFRTPTAVLGTPRSARPAEVVKPASRSRASRT
ncbi:MFS transporter [Streptomyces sp. NEAU-YJ-81]|uniref:MFS transporter n=1 Tax=Streptomyces sp. NEAU-YJ-81 TaxID=2820288 RepID=UPI001ABD2A35|nr:MFS transporter [Streptomyces sp. NEAU-YJ-81]MBO3682522.1 MFS transporter [Streptomyces sp. NEAU-YJ-81]